jgi:hypothetical protein
LVICNVFMFQPDIVWYFIMKITFATLRFRGRALQNDPNTHVCGIGHGNRPRLRKRMCKKWGLFQCIRKINPPQTPYVMYKFVT